jgi:hypothetical protein
MRKSIEKMLNKYVKKKMKLENIIPSNFILDSFFKFINWKMIVLQI